SPAAPLASSATRTGRACTSNSCKWDDAPMKLIAPKGLLKIVARNRDRSPWYARVGRITNWRIVSQLFFLALFLFLLWVTWFSRLRGYPVSLLLEMDPLVSFDT